MTTTAPPPTSTPAPRTAADTWQRKTARIVADYAMPLLVLFVLVLASVTTDGFADGANLRAILISTAITGIAAVGMTAITLTGNLFSLGIGSTVVLCGIVFLAVAGATGSVLVGVLVAVGASLLLGLAQALIVGAGLNPVITTLAFGAIVYGCVAVGTGGEVVTAGSVPVTRLATASVLGLPLPVIIFIAMTALVSFLTARTVTGRRMRLLGENRATAGTSGISAMKGTVVAFASLSVGAALAGILSAAQLRQMQANDLPNLTLDVIAAVLVGGAAINGGEASAVRTALGALLIVILGNVMLLQGLAPGERLFGVGAVVVVLVVLLHLLRKAGAR
ncbi:ABC transporter permease [Klenkia taihuensis]|uniref:Ribose transport system permease protein n=1 Tax=Klenkia taihuensis TaxID=1225127 RepID=A0A1I1U5H1_9ACTN|nr:ABC transporter permease [Klenkia taihuensis]GHE06973.1 ribose ABC transporter permease [Klenkia taihuensis]SFD64868.1 ribose transport system permease protein [Klenkia taihuensis]